jgi:hypothetical protein
VRFVFFGNKQGDVAYDCIRPILLFIWHKNTHHSQKGATKEFENQLEWSLYEPMILNSEPIRPLFKRPMQGTAGHNVTKPRS